MKKKNIFYAGVLALSLSLSGCSDSFLDMNNYGAYDDFGSESKINWYLAGLYQYYYENYTAPGYQYLGLHSSWKDDPNEYTEEEFGITSTSRIDPSTSYGSIDDIRPQTDASGQHYDPLLSSYFGNTLGSSVTNNAYTRIRNCNILLRDIDGLSVDTEVKRRAKGQALVLRALQLFDLVRVYGPVPVVTTVLNAEAGDTGLPRASVTQCVQQILADLEEAATLLPAKWDANNYGRFTSEAALAYKSRVALFYASPIFNKDWNNEGNQRWHQALAITEDAINRIKECGLGGVNSASAWGAVLADDNNTVPNKEGLMARLLTGEEGDSYKHNRWEGSIRLSSQGGSGSKAVPLELIDMFPMSDGSLPGDAHKTSRGSLRFMEGRDPRFYQTFAFSGLKWGYKENVNDTVWSYRWRTTESLTSGMAYAEGVNIASPVTVRKMSGLTTSSKDYSLSAVHIYDYRYAELVLNLAECYAATGQLDKCKAEIGKLRARVGIPAAGNYGLDTYVTDRASALSACLRERLVELAYEGKRYWDVWRWMLYDGGQGKTGKGESMQLSTTNTCAFLGVTPLTERFRTSKYIDVKDGYTLGSDDMLAEARKNIFADPDSPDFAAQLTAVADFWEANFQYGEPSSQPDKDSNNNWIKLGWKTNYYILGLSKTILDSNSWLGQTKGWTDENGVPGTVDWQDDEVLVLE